MYADVAYTKDRAAGQNRPGLPSFAREKSNRPIVHVGATANHREAVASVGPGLRALHHFSGKKFGLQTYRNLVIGLTFLAYASYNAARRPISIVKPVLHHPEKSGGAWCGGTSPAAIDSKEPTPEWKPFNGEKGQMRLGDVDLAFLSAYAVGGMISGHIADQVDPRHFLLIGMLGSGAASILVSFGYFKNIHNTWFYVLGQILSGLFQSTGWPVVVAIVAHWFTKGKRGLAMGLWTAHSPLGSIVGSLMSASVLTYGWGWCFLLLGLLIAAAGVFIWCFLVVHPADVGLAEPKINALERKGGDGVAEDSIRAPLLPASDSFSTANAQPKSIGFFRAWCIPGVLPFALSLFCSKLVAYTFIFWLPFYATSTCIQGRSLSVEEATALSTIFDVASAIGALLTGYLSDLTQSSASVSTAFALLAIPSLYLYNLIGHVSLWLNAVLLLLTGICVHGPFALITTAVSADLGSHESLQHNERALSTVTAIIGGMGSVGAAVGPTITGVLLSGKGKGNFDRVFSMLAACSFAAGVMLCGLVWKELKAWLQRGKYGGTCDEETCPQGNCSSIKTLGEGYNR
ncbi:hypothetical protein BSKO_12417 [Bryopsis sp. KO-2023]|nr:hypothetical protein BSKO_12417 [Bryopsis sp. KO-2023]